MPGKRPTIRTTSRCGPVIPYAASIRFDADCSAWSTAHSSRMKSSTAPSGGPLSSSTSSSGPLDMVCVQTISHGPGGSATSLDQRCKLLELGGAGDAEQVEEHRLGAGLRGAGLLAQPKAGGPVRFGSREHRVLDD